MQILAQGLVGLQVEANELGVVLCHLFKVRHGPIGSGRVAEEAPHFLVKYAAGGHIRQRQLHDTLELGVGRAVVQRESQLQRFGVWELGRISEAAVRAVEVGDEAAGDVLNDDRRNWAGGPRLPTRVATSGFGLRQALGELIQPGTRVRPRQSRPACSYRGALDEWEDGRDATSAAGR